MTTKEQILELVKKYYKEQNSIKKEYETGDRITYAARVYDEEEMVNLVDSSLEFWLTSGRYCEQFEKDMAKYLGIKLPVLLVNSGSSANLIAFMTLTAPELGERAIKRGDEVITVACGFPTTVTPIINYGAVPVFVDVTIPQYNIDVNELEKALSNKTKAVMIAHTLGNPFDLKSVKDFCNKHNLWLIEDNCDALGSKYTIDGEEKFTGTIGDIGTSSFYPPHHMTMGEGGAVYTRNPILYRIAKSMRDWGRDCICPSGVDNYCGHRFDGQYGELPKGYDHKYTYSHIGYNLKITDWQASIGLAQLKKLDKFLQIRRQNAETLFSLLTDLQDYFILPKVNENCKQSWFGFLLSVKENAPFSKNEVVEYLEKHGVGTRQLFAGNILRQPMFVQNNIALRIGCSPLLNSAELTEKEYALLPNTEFIMNHTFWVGVAQNNNVDDMQKIAEVLHNFIKEKAGK